MSEEPRDLDHLIAEIYAASGNPARWRHVVKRLHRFFPAGTAVIYGHDETVGRNFGMIQSGMSEIEEREFVSHYAQVSPFATGIRQAALGKPVRSLDLCDWDTLSRSEYFNDFMVPRNSGAGGAIVAFREEKRSLLITIDCDYRQRDEIEPEISKLLQRVAFHAVQSFRLTRQMLGLQFDRNNAAQIARAMPDATFVVDSRLRVLEMNDEAVSLARQAKVLRLKQGRLVFENSASQQFLERCNDTISSQNLKELAVDHAAKGPGGWYFVAVCPINADADADTDLLFRTMQFSAPGMVVSVRTQKPMDGRKLEFARKAFRLTQAEVKLAGAVVSGRDLKSHADANGLSINTVRQQMQAILHKTDTHRQAELVALLARLAG